MEGLIAELKVWVPLAVGLCSLVGISITIFLLGWRIPSKAEMNRGDDNLQQQINHGIDLTLAVTKEIREDMRQMRSEILTLADKIESISQTIHADISKLNDKIDSNSQAIRTDMSKLSDKLNDKIDSNSQAIRTDMGKLSDKLNDKIDSNSQAIHEKIDTGTRDLRTEIRELNQNYKAHLAHHNENEQS